MLKNFVLLISSLLSINSFAGIEEYKPDNLSVTGFAYITDFGDHNWYEGNKILAVNLDWHTGNFAARTQLSSYSNQMVRRAVLEYSVPVDQTDITGRVGRFTRLDTFYNGITDSPSSWGQALLPQAGYSYRMQNGMFVIMDGVQLQFVTKINPSVLNVTKYSKGTSSIPDQSDIQNEALHKVIPGLELTSLANSDESLSTRFVTENTQWYASRDKYRMTPEIVGAPNKTLTTIKYLYNFMTYDIDKVGVQYDDAKYLGQIEWFHDSFETYTAALKQSSAQNAVGWNALAGYYVFDNVKTYVGKSAARARQAGGNAQFDEYVGVTWIKKPFTVSFEYHAGEGFAWRKYEFVTLPKGVLPDWHTWVISSTYSF